MLSLTVTVALQVDELLLPSVTVKTTVFEPQDKALGETERLTGPQLSYEPLSTCDDVIETLPEEPIGIVIFLHTATGGILSGLTVTIELQLAVLP